MQKRNNYFTMRNLYSDSSRKPNAIKSVYRAVNILFCLSNDINTVTDISRSCGLSKPTVYRLLKTLEDTLLVMQDPVTHRYYLGPLINQITANPQANHQYLINCALDELRRLWDFSGETVELNIIVGMQYIRLYEIQSKFELKVVAGPDPVGPVYVGATAKVLLSQLDDNELITALNYIKLTRVTEHSIVDKDELMAQAKEIRRKGHSVSYGERIPGALCISAPIKNYFLPVALSLVGPVSRLEPRIDEMIKEVVAGSSHITDSIAEFFREKGVITNAQVTV